MANFSQVGRPKEFKGTPAGGAAVTINDLTELTIAFDPELIEHFGGSNRFPRYVVGNDNTTISLKTTDAQALKFLKGMEVTAVSCDFEATATVVGATGAVTKGSGTIGMSATGAWRVIEVVQITGQADGKPVEFSIKLRAAIQESDGTEPTLTFDLDLAEA